MVNHTENCPQDREANNVRTHYGDLVGAQRCIGGNDDDDDADVLGVVPMA